MQNKKTLFALAAALVLAAPVAMAADPSTKTSTEYEQGDNGGYISKKTVEKEDADGTVVKHQTAVSVEKDDEGNMKKTVEQKTTTDPEGLMNKSTVKTSETVIEGKDKNEYTHEKVVDGDVVEKETTVEVKD